MRKTLRSDLETGSRRRDELLAAAEQLIVERGLSALTVDDVTGRAGVAKGTFYIYFSAKGELLAALRERYAAAICAEQERALAELPAEDHGGRLDRWVAEAIGAHLEHERLHDALFHHELPADAIKTGVTAANPQLDLLERILGAGAAAGAFALADVETATALLYGAMHAAVDLLLDRGQRPLDVDRVLSATQRFARGAVGADAAG
ncbi:helix-turn-helix domain-containing protein [Conexibacter stalactiti]|uniref:Helix-turn-helix domain-containing protein n=1 Tax=Conexibacter stalactiti TaxID=1940611 RepID=A0ABU4HUW6_9ACTN|nr:helix-turn-helix domain-containing protein [Conexibacter stalactiti]MDW5597083.1 helix-turn-helix domain-containing protein [Conexibacter stalactiti]MEC5037725.1 helix-turn-helix domain-containing protein [Conexibacter stalactiti]